MDEINPLVGPVYGWRTWTLATTGSKWLGQQHRLRSHRGTVWNEPRQQAKCLRGPGAYLSTIYDPPATERHDHEPVTDLTCWCGLYAHATLARCLDDREPYLSWRPPHAGWWEPRTPPDSVLGLVSASGRIIAAERGFRAQTMTVETLVCLHHRGREQPHVREVGRELGVPVVCARLTRKSLDRRFANREGVYLWQEEAPWISDVTSESSKSSTRTRRPSLAHHHVHWSSLLTMPPPPPPPPLSAQGRAEEDDGGDGPVEGGET